MGSEHDSTFECAACGVELPARTVRYDPLGYPECRECGARTGPLASVEAEESAGGLAG